MNTIRDHTFIYAVDPDKLWRMIISLVKPQRTFLYDLKIWEGPYEI